MNWLYDQLHCCADFKIPQGTETLWSLLKLRSHSIWLEQRKHIHHSTFSHLCYLSSNHTVHHALLITLFGCHWCEIHGRVSEISDKNVTSFSVENYALYLSSPFSCFPKSFLFDLLLTPTSFSALLPLEFLQLLSVFLCAVIRLDRRACVFGWWQRGWKPVLDRVNESRVSRRPHARWYRRHIPRHPAHRVRLALPPSLPHGPFAAPQRALTLPQCIRRSVWNGISLQGVLWLRLWPSLNGGGWWVIYWW